MEVKAVNGTKEWAVHNENFLIGCSHDCSYCFAKAMSVRFKRKTQDDWKNVEIIEKKFNKRQKKYKGGRVMFPSSHDILPEFIDQSVSFMKNLLDYDNDLLVVSKPHLECIKKICSEFPDFKNKILFRFTIGSPKETVLKYWEPGAPSPKERLESLKYAYSSGFSTSISIEPMLDNLEQIKVLIDLCLPYVTDAIWIGKPNRMQSRLTLNGKPPSVDKKLLEFSKWYSDLEIRRLYKSYKTNPKIKWKESIKKNRWNKN